MRSEWQEVTLKDCVSVLGDGLHGTPIYDENGEYFFINGNNLKDNKIIVKSDTKKVANAEYIKHKKPLTNRTLLVSINGTLGNIGVYNNEKVILGKSACYFNVLETINKDFIRYVLTDKCFQEYIVRYATGTTIKNASLKQMREYSFYLPPLPVQHAIAATLSCLDEKIELNNKINANLEVQAQAIFKSWFVDFEPFQDGEFVDSELGRIPKGWRVGKFTEAVGVLGGGTPKTDNQDYWNGEIPFFTPKDVNGIYTLATEKYLTIEGVENCNSRLYPTNTVFITARGTVGKIALSGVEMAMNQSCYALQGKDGYSQFFVYGMAQKLVNALRHKSSGAVFNAIVTRDFDTEYIVLPDRDIVEQYHHIVAPLFDLLLHNTKQSHVLTALRDILLPKLMNGEIEVPVEEITR